MNNAQRNIDRLTDEDTSKLKRAYQDILEETKIASGQVTDATIERAIMFKARSNAQRLVRTESARAYGNARLLEIKKDGDAVGIRWSLSGDHEDIGCICEELAETDWGMGEGVYPIDQCPEYPAHPNCDCILDPVYKGDPDNYDDSDSEGDWDTQEVFLDEDQVE